MEKQRLAVCFADMSGFERVARALGSLKTTELLDEAYAAVGDIVVAHNGTIRKYAGDSIMFTMSDPAEAIRAANEIASSFRRVVGDTELRFSIGVATGDVVVAEVGHSSLRVEDVFGGVVNHAARLITEARMRPNGVALCTETQRYA